ncbi:alpha/beta fold hydrolase [Gilvimarinus polysaccharolyticus]|uniref:alpha/beta fold hydrolase n=1 Tax=Gilvimarinus polysaccharolyticus TaxID=863921 RepID=UPI0006732CC4|nr:alpha/beta hydrolase [Gilvimarinus polysaccharolyticus]
MSFICSFKRYVKAVLRLCVTLFLFAAITAQAQVLVRLAEKNVQVPAILPALTSVAQAGFVYEPVFNSRMYLVEAGVGHSETVILVHGLGENGYRDWRAVIPALAQRYHVLAMDLPGFGLSQKPSGRYSPTQYARVIQWLVSQTGQERVYLVGHSMGGAVSLRYAASFPETLHRVVLVSVAGVLQRAAFLSHSSALPIVSDGVPYINKLPTPIKDMAGEQLRDWGSRLLSYAERLPDPMAVLHASDTAWSGLLGDQPNANAALALVGEDFTQAFDQVAMPALIVWGDQDPIAPPRTGVLLEGQLPNAKRVVFNNTGHVPMSQADKFNTLLLDFLTAPIEPTQQDKRPLSSGDLTCHNLRDQHYTGVFNAIDLRGCNGAVLDTVQATSIYIADSDVELRNVKVLSQQVALTVNQSQVTMTNGELIGRKGIVVSASQLDLAGVTVRGSESAVSATEPSTVIFSVSNIHGPTINRAVHGVFELGSE